MTSEIGVQSWMTEPDTMLVIAALEARGFRGCARFVGGAVRNSLMGLVVDDIDIATTLTPDQVIEALEAAGLKAVPTGVEHGTVTAVSGGKPFEITTLRRDVATDGRHAEVAFTQSWDEDARRRDFRFNALYADVDGKVFDPTGHGVEDARAGRVMFVGDALTRLREDYLRILRFFRFHAWYGRGEPDAAALSACRALKGMLAGRSAERVQKELLKLLAAPDPRDALRLMVKTQILAEVLPQARDLNRLERLVEVEGLTGAEPDAALRLAALLPDDRKAGAATAERLRLSNALRDRLNAALDPEPKLTSWMSPRAARRAIWKSGASAFADRVHLAWAGSTNTAAASQWRALLALGEAWTPPAFPIGGDQVAAAGVPKGPLVGEVLREVEAWWVDHDFPDDRLAALEQLKAVVEGLAY
jgi:poly(A) polymerase